MRGIWWCVSASLVVACSSNSIVVKGAGDDSDAGAPVDPEPIGGGGRTACTIDSNFQSQTPLVFEHTSSRSALLAFSIAPDENFVVVEYCPSKGNFDDCQFETATRSKPSEAFPKLTPAMAADLPTGLVRTSFNLTKDGLELYYAETPPTVSEAKVYRAVRKSVTDRFEAPEPATIPAPPKYVGDWTEVLPNADGSRLYLVLPTNVGRVYQAEHSKVFGDAHKPVFEAPEELKLASIDGNVVSVTLSPDELSIYVTVEASVTAGVGPTSLFLLTRKSRDDLSFEHPVRLDGVTDKATYATLARASADHCRLYYMSSLVDDLSIAPKPTLATR